MVNYKCHKYTEMDVIDMSELKYKRVLLKLSGEALAADKSQGILSFDFMAEVCKTIKECVALGAQVAVITGGGNIWRGRSGGNIDRSKSDNIGMLATVINSLGFCTALEGEGVDAVVMSALQMDKVCEFYTKEKAVKALSEGKVVIVAGGTGNPFFSTDTAAALRAAELEVDMILCAKNIDAVYTADPEKDPNAKKLDTISYDEIIDKELGVIDLSASLFCRENKIPQLIFGLAQPENIIKAITGEKVGTTVTV